MKILLAHNDYAKYSGEENAVDVMTQVLRSNGHSIIDFRRSSDQIGKSIGNKIHAFVEGIYSKKSRESIAALLRHQQFDLVQVQNLYPFISPSILAECRLQRVPVVMRCPNYRVFCPNGLHLSHGKVCERCLGGKEWNCILRNCEDNIFKSVGYAARNAFARTSGMITNNVTIFIVLSEFQKQRFINGGIPADRIAILPNVSPISDTNQGSDVGEDVSFVGRVSPEKGIYEFLETARNLPDLKFSVAGSADTMPDITSVAGSNVDFTGFLSGNEFIKFYLKSRILVFPSIWFEGFPNVIARAMAYGKPVVASRIGAIPEIVEDGVTGLLFEPGNAADLSEKIKYLWERPDLCTKMGAAGLAKAKRAYSEEYYYETLINIYEKAITMNAARN